MNKRQTVWLIVRFIGICFIFFAIVTLFGGISEYFSSGSAGSATKLNTNTARPQIPTPQIVNPALPVAKSESEKADDKLKSDALKGLFWQIFLALIYGGIGFYLIRNGKILFTTLIREDSMDETEEIISSAPATSKEKTVTTLDLSPSLPSKKEEVTSLNLSEYVPKSQQTAPPIVVTEPLKEEISAPIDVQKEPIEFVETPTIEPVNQPFYADEQPTLIRQIETISEEEPLELIEPPIIEETVKKRVRKVKEIAPTEIVSVIDEQPNETSAPSDISANLPSEEKK